MSCLIAAQLPVVSEAYDEIVFTDPTPEFKRQLAMYSSTGGASASGASGAAGVRGITEKTVGSVTVCTIFQDDACLMGTHSPLLSQEHFTIFSDEEDVRLLTLAHDYVQAEIEGRDTDLILSTSTFPILLIANYFVAAAKAQLLRLEVMANSAAALQQQQQQQAPPPQPQSQQQQAAAPMQPQPGAGGAAFLPPPPQVGPTSSSQHQSMMASRKGRSTPTSAGVDLGAGAGGSAGTSGLVSAAVAVAASRGPSSSLPAGAAPSMSAQRIGLSSASAPSAPGLSADAAPLPSSAVLHGYRAQPLPSLAGTPPPTFAPTMQQQQVYLTPQPPQPVLQRGPSAHLLSSSAAPVPPVAATATAAAMEGGLSYHSALPGPQ
jgi:hypothetical protein